MQPSFKVLLFPFFHDLMGEKGKGRRCFERKILFRILPPWFWSKNSQRKTNSAITSNKSSETIDLSVWKDSLIGCLNMINWCSKKEMIWLGFGYDKHFKQKWELFFLHHAKGKPKRVIFIDNFFKLWKLWILSSVGKNEIENIIKWAVKADFFRHGNNSSLRSNYIFWIMIFILITLFTKVTRNLIIFNYFCDLKILFD